MLLPFGRRLRRRRGRRPARLHGQLARRCAKDRPAAARSGGPAAVRLGLGAADDQVEHEARPRRGSCGRRKTTTQATAGGVARPARAAERG